MLRNNVIFLWSFEDVNGLVWHTVVYDLQINFFRFFYDTPHVFSWKYNRKLIYLFFSINIKINIIDINNRYKNTIDVKVI